MTRAQLVAVIQMEARVKASANLVPMIQDIIIDVLRDYANKSRYYELLQTNIPITLVDQQQVYSLPTDFNHLHRIQFSPQIAQAPWSPAVWRELIKQPEIIKRTSACGLPLYYELVAGPKISLWPYLGVQAVHNLTVDYYQDPLTLFNSDASVFPIPRLTPAVKKETIARVQRFHASLPEGQMMDADGKGSFIASESAK